MINLSKRSYYLLLALIGLIVYANSFSNSFVWDDEILIVQNGYIKSFKYIPKIFSVDIYHWTTQSNFYRPFFSLSLMLDYSLWKLNPLGYHLTNFILHLLNTFLIFYLINFLISNLKVSLLGSLLYLVHPLHTQAVTYISGRADLLAGFFILGTVLFFALSAKTEGRHKNLFYFASIFFFICGLLSKEIVLVLPLVLILYDYCFGHLFKNIKKHTAFLLLALLYIILREQFLSFNPEGMLPYNLWVRLINLPKVIVFYLWLLVFPLNLRIERSLRLSESFDLPVFLSSILLIIILAGVFKNRRKRIYLFSCLWFFINLLPVSNIVLPLNAEIAEHWLYLPSMGFFIILALGVDKLLLKDSFVAGQRLSYKFKMTILVAVVTALGLLTISRNFEWRNPIILFEATLKSSLRHKLNPKDTRVRFNLGHAYLSGGFYDKAILEFNEALKGLAFPRCRRVHYQLAFAYLGKSSYKEAEEELIKAIEADPNYVSAYHLLGNLYKKTGDIDKANQMWNKMLKIKPLHPREEILIRKVKEHLDSRPDLY